MGRPRVVGSVITALLLLGGVLSGCVEDAPEPTTVDYSKLGVPIPSPSGSYATPKPKGKAPGKNADPTEQILYDLQQRVVRTAGVSAKTKASCEGGLITGTIDQTVTCRVTYQQIVVTYRVEIQGGTPTFSWVATTDKSVLTAEGVGRAYWAKFGPGASQVRCDKLPAAKLVPLGKDVDLRCYHKAGGNWREHAVLLKDGGIKFRAVEAD